MTVKFKLIKYRHLIEAQALGVDLNGAKDIKLGDPQSAALLEFMASLIKEWDYVDEETGQVIPLGDYGELTIEQFIELSSEFNARMQGIKSGVKKTKTVTSGSKSSYGLTRSRPAKKAATYPTRPNG